MFQHPQEPQSHQQGPLHDATATDQTKTTIGEKEITREAPAERQTKEGEVTILTNAQGTERSNPLVTIFHLPIRLFVSSYRR